jgi:hypothetical protein
MSTRLFSLALTARITTPVLIKDRDVVVRVHASVEESAFHVTC